jgi:hypothetical protein
MHYWITGTYTVGSTAIRTKCQLKLIYIRETALKRKKLRLPCKHDGRGDVLDAVVHQNFSMSNVIVAGILDLNNIKRSGPYCNEFCFRSSWNLTDWELFQSLASELILPNDQNQSSDVTDEATRDFIASTAPAYKLPKRKTAIFGRKYEIPGLKRLLKHKKVQTIRKGTRDPHAKRQ